MWEARPGASALIRTVWRALVETPGSYPVSGSEYWSLSFVRRPGDVLAAVLDGPKLKAHVVDGIVGEEYWGVELAAHVTIPGVSKRAILGETVDLPVVDGTVELAGRRWPFPYWDDLEQWVDELVAGGGLLVHEDVRRALVGERRGASQRTWQRRFRRSVGLTSQQIDQLRRVENGYLLLQSGSSPAEAAYEAGFADQAHFTRALRMIRGQTPAAVLAAARGREEASTA